MIQDHLRKSAHATEMFNALERSYLWIRKNGVNKTERFVVRFLLCNGQFSVKNIEPHTVIVCQTNSKVVKIMSDVNC